MNFYFLVSILLLAPLYNCAYYKELAEVPNIDQNTHKVVQKITLQQEEHPLQQPCKLNESMSSPLTKQVPKIDVINTSTAKNVVPCQKLPSIVIPTLRTEILPIIEAKAEITPPAPPCALDKTEPLAQKQAVPVHKKDVPISAPTKLTTPSGATTKVPSRKLTIVNNITEDMITYKKHWSGHHKPNNFHVKINDTMVSTLLVKESSKKRNRSAKESLASTTKEIAADDTLNIEFYCKFSPMGITYHEETKKYCCSVPKTAQKLETTFSWDVDSRIVINALNADNTKSTLTVVEIS